MVIYEAGGTTDRPGVPTADAADAADAVVMVGLGLSEEDLGRLQRGETIGISTARLTALARADYVCVHRGEDGAAIARALQYTEERRHTDLSQFKRRAVILDGDGAKQG